MSWWKVSFYCDDSVELELLCQNLLTEGAMAIQEIAENQCETYFEQADLSRIDLESMLQFCGLMDFEVSELQQENWMEGAQKFFQPLEIGKLKFDFIWERPQEKPSQRRITILPGMGFGSGHHPTTRMILELVQSASLTNIQPKKILDFGTGSGILSIAMKRLYPDSEIDAVDNDAQAILNAKDNCELNSSKINISNLPLNELTAGYDLIVANIFLSVLTSSSLELRRLLAENGLLILSGITSNQLLELKESYSDWSILEEKCLDDWNALVLRR